MSRPIRNPGRSAVCLSEMIDKSKFCEAFCGDLHLRQVPAGYAVQTGFSLSNGDAIGFYLTRDNADDQMWRVEDSGLTVPTLEASGVNIDSGQRAEAFSRLLLEYGVAYDQDAMELRSKYVTQEELPHEAIRFIAFMMRVHGLELLDTATVEKTFQEDAKRSISEYFDGVARVKFRDEMLEESKEKDFNPDALISNLDETKSLLVYFGSTRARIDEAVIHALDSRAKKSSRDLIGLLLESVTPPNVAKQAVERALNRVDEAAIFGTDVAAAMARLGKAIDVIPKTEATAAH